jgi:hypothetical protein
MGVAINDNMSEVANRELALERGSDFGSVAIVETASAKSGDGGPSEGQ